MKIPPELTKERERIAWELRLKCWTQECIATELNISQSAVSQILKRLSTRYHNENMAEIEQTKIMQVAQLEYIAYEAMLAWERSKTSNSLKNDARFLITAMKAKEEIRKILRIDASSKIAINEKFLEYNNMSDEELLKKVEEILVEKRQPKVSLPLIS